MLVLTVLCVLRNRRDTECFDRKIDIESIKSGITIALITFLVLFTGIMALTVFEPGCGCSGPDVRSGIRYGYGRIVCGPDAESYKGESISC